MSYKCTHCGWPYHPGPDKKCPNCGKDDYSSVGLFLVIAVIAIAVFAFAAVGLGVLAIKALREGRTKKAWWAFAGSLVVATAIIAAYFSKQMPDFFYEDSDFWHWTIYPSFAAYPLAVVFYVLHRKRALKDMPDARRTLAHDVGHTTASIAKERNPETNDRQATPGSVRDQLVQEARRRAGQPLQAPADIPASAAAPQTIDRWSVVEAASPTAPVATDGDGPAGKQATPSSSLAQPKNLTKRILLIAGSIVVLASAIWIGIELSKRHTLTAAERAQAEGWFSNLRNGQWVLMPKTGPVRQDYALEYEPVSVSADKYGMTTIRAHVVLRSIASGTTIRYGAVQERPYSNLSEPAELWLADDNDTPGEGTSIMLRSITSDSVEVEFSGEEGPGEVLAGVPEHRFNTLRTAAEAGQRSALVNSLDSIAQGTGLVRRGIFHAYACGDECGATFMEARSGTVVPITYVCNNNRFGDIQLSQGDMLGAGDFTNKALVGQRFLIVSKLVTLPDHEGIPIWVVQGLFPDVEGGGFPELDQRLALSANFDAGAGMTPTGAGTSEATLNTRVSFLDDSDILDSKDVQQQPEFPGGMEKMYEFMAKNQHYPDMEYEAGIQGKVYVQFTVSKDGSIKDTRVLRSVSEGLDHEALRLVKSMPRWMPGSLDGRPVNCRFNLPITFRLK